MFKDYHRLTRTWPLLKTLDHDYFPNDAVDRCIGSRKTCALSGSDVDGLQACIRVKSVGETSSSSLPDSLHTGRRRPRARLSSWSGRNSGNAAEREVLWIMLVKLTCGEVRERDSLLQAEWDHKGNTTSSDVVSEWLHLDQEWEECLLYYDYS